MIKTFEFGQVVLLDFPFTNQNQAKLRPALIILDTDDNDILVSRITSTQAKSSFDMTIVQWEQAGLSLPSSLRTHKIATLEKSLIKFVLGKLQEKDHEKARELFGKLFTELV